MTLRLSFVLPALLFAAAGTMLHAQERSMAGPGPGPAPDDSTQTRGQPVTPLTLDEVLSASARHAPEIIAALARMRQAEGRALSAEGAFDTVFLVDSRSRVEGYYDGSEITGVAERPLTGNGGYLYGQYRNSRGNFPIYEDRAFTNRLGEVKVGALYSLMRDRLIDARRANRGLAENDINIARFETRATGIGVQAGAVEAYQKWVAWGLKLKAYEALYDLAAMRSRGIERQVRLGAQPDILLTENEANMVKREALVIEAQQEFEGAANRLSLYFRDAQGLPVIVEPTRLPSEAEAFDGLRINPMFNVENRPDFGALAEEIDSAALNLALAENATRPKLDLKGEIAKDVGPEGLGGYSRTPLEVIVGVSFKMPLQNRAAKGKVAENRAKIEELSVKQRYLGEKIRAEVAGIGIEVEAARKLVETTRSQRDLAGTLARAERRRFELGSSDFFLVNHREEAATDAEVALIDARARVAAAHTQLAAATADQDAFGLD